MNYFTDAAFEFEASSIESITLSESQIDQARELSHQIHYEARQWQTYLNALALFGFEQWLLERAPELHFNLDNCSIFQPEFTSFIEAVFNLKLSTFNLCLMAMGSLSEKAITFSRAVIDLPEFTAHFYGVIEVTEELEQVTIQGFLSYDQLIEHCRSSHLQAEPNWTYQLPLTWFEKSPDNLLQSLRSLESDAIALPPIPLRPPDPLPELEFAQLLPQLQASEGRLWNVLTWEQGAALLTNPKLLNRLVANPQREEESPQEQVASRENVMQLLKEPIVNVGLWLRDEMDEVTQKLSWVLLPTFAPEAVPLRSPTQELESIIKQLERTGTTVPPVARGAYQDFKLAEIPLRIYVVTWPRLSPKNIPAWTLLLILGAAPGTNLAHPVKLLLSDETRVLLERVLEPNTEETYLYAQAVGTWDEEFSVTITATENASLTFPPFVFRPN